MKLPDGISPADGLEADGNEPSAPPAEIVERLEPFVRPERVQEAASVVHSMLVAQSSHSGPLPPAREFARYDEVLPGAADRIIAMAEREQEHRNSLEGSVVTAEVRSRMRGQAFALTALLASLTVVGLIAYWGHPVPATGLGSAVIVAVVALFLGQKWTPNRPTDTPT